MPKGVIPVTIDAYTTWLLGYLIEIARDNGIDGFTALVHPDNFDMLRILEASGHTVKKKYKSGSYEFVIEFIHGLEKENSIRAEKNRGGHLANFDISGTGVSSGISSDSFGSRRMRYEALCVETLPDTDCKQTEIGEWTFQIILSRLYCGT